MVRPFPAFPVLSLSHSHEKNLVPARIFNFYHHAFAHIVLLTGFPLPLPSAYSDLSLNSVSTSSWGLFDHLSSYQLYVPLNLYSTNWIEHLFIMICYLYVCILYLCVDGKGEFLLLCSQHIASAFKKHLLKDM